MDVLRSNNSKNRSHLRWLCHLITKTPWKAWRITQVYIDTLEKIGGDREFIAFLRLLQASLLSRGLGLTLEGWRKTEGITRDFVEEIERRERE
jgi:hypothetical protein